MLVVAKVWGILKSKYPTYCRWITVACYVLEQSFLFCVNLISESQLASHTFEPHHKILAVSE